VTFDSTGFVFICPTNKIVGDADINCASRAAGEKVNVVLGHTPSLPKRDGRDKPGHDKLMLRATKLG
jgi:hypothetical protein